MSTNEPDVVPEGAALREAPQAHLEAIPEGARMWFGRARWLAMLAGLIAGLVAFAIGEATYELIPAAKVEQNLMGSIVMVTDRTTNMVADTRNGAVAFGVLGLCLGGCLGMAGGLARRSTSGAMTGGLLGAVLGLVLGAGVSLALLPRFLSMRFDYFNYDLIISMVMHGLIWGLLGAAAGLAFAVGLGEPSLRGRSLTAGLLGAMLGAIAFDLIGAALLPMAETDQPISESWPTRLMARLLVTVGTAVVVVLLLPESHDDAVAHQAKAATPSAQT